MSSVIKLYADNDMAFNSKMFLSRLSEKVSWCQCSNKKEPLGSSKVSRVI